MALIGLKFCAAARADYSTGVPVFSDGRLIGKGISMDKSVSFSNADLSADDDIQETDTSFESGTLKINTDDYGFKKEDILPVQAFLFGNEYVAATEAEPAYIRRSADDSAPYVGVAYIKTRQKDNVRSYEVTLIYKAKFTPPGESAKTKGKSTEFSTPEIEGNFYTTAVNTDKSKPQSTYEDIYIFDDYASAVDFIKKKFKFQAAPAVTSDTPAGTEPVNI